MNEAWQIGIRQKYDNFDENFSYKQIISVFLIQFSLSTEM